jgi:hypothetical protein
MNMIKSEKPRTSATIADLQPHAGAKTIYLDHGGIAVEKARNNF